MDEEELLSAIKDVVDWKLLGMDGLSSEFYMKPWPSDWKASRNVRGSSWGLQLGEKLNVRLRKAYTKRDQEKSWRGGWLVRELKIHYPS